MNLGSIIILLGDKGCQSLLNQGVKIAKLKSFMLLLKYISISPMKYFPNRIFYNDFKVDF